MGWWGILTGTHDDDEPKPSFGDRAAMKMYEIRNGPYKGEALRWEGNLWTGYHITSDKEQAKGK